ncbi:MAG: response regulator transcription factor [Baekduia sp.]
MRTETRPTVLIAEDREDTRALLAAELSADGYDVIACGTVASARQSVATVFPDIVVTESVLPDGSGLDLVRVVRGGGGAADPELPIVVLSTRCTESDRVRAFESGADDFVAKPFSYRELRGRIQAILRRREGGNRRRPLRVGELELDPLRREVRYGDIPLTLTQREFALLEQLASQPMRVFTKDELMRTIWGYRGPEGVQTRTLDSHACRLRAKLTGAGAPVLVDNIWGVGYRLRDPAAEEAVV